VVKVTTPDDAVKVAVDRVAHWLKDPVLTGGTVCVMVPTKSLRTAVAEALEARQTPVSVIDADTADTASADAVRVATMHRAKGLEFDRVVVLAPEGAHAPGDSDMAQLMYVSLTRAKTAAVLVR
jgi:superfamily I DNA/RNA helicase